MTNFPRLDFSLDKATEFFDRLIGKANHREESGQHIWALAQVIRVIIDPVNKIGTIDKIAPGWTDPKYAVTPEMEQTLYAAVGWLAGHRLIELTN